MMNLSLKPFALFALLVLGTFSCLDKAKFIASDAGRTDVKTDIVERDVRDKIDMPDMTVRPECEKCEQGEICDALTGFNCVAGCIDEMNCDGQICNDEIRKCVDCIDNSTCTTVGESMCSQKNECIECEEGMNACGHLSATPRCNAGKCEAGCEQDSHCIGTDICDLTTNECTAKVAGDASQCGECVSDTHCETGSYCVPLSYGASFFGNFCLQVQKQDSDCGKPWGVEIAGKTSLGGKTNQVYCGINEMLATCAAVLDTRACGSDSENLSLCNDSDNAARCEYASATGWECTYSCRDDVECRGVCLNDGYCEQTVF